MLRIVATRALTTTVVRQMDPIQAIFINKIRQYAADSAAAGGPGKFLSELLNKTNFLSEVFLRKHLFVGSFFV